MLMKNTQRLGPQVQRGMSLVELMVGIAIGLIIVAAAALMLSGQLGENRRLLAETQLQQDLRAATDIVTRELRRAGAQNEANSLQTLWYPGLTTAVRVNSRAEPLTPTPTTGNASQVGFTYNPGGGGAGTFGFKLENGAIKTLLLAGGWQELTDPKAINVTGFVITRLPDTKIQLPCAKRCADDTAACWPSINLRNFSVAITATAQGVAGVERSIQSRVRVRNDYLQFSEPGLVCPA